MTNDKALENQLDEEIYKKYPFFKIKYIFIFFVFLFIGFLFCFPVLEQVDYLLKKTIIVAAPCGIKYEKLDYSFFPPQLQIKKPIISSKCIKSTQDLMLSDISILFGIPNLSPVGLNFLIQTNVHKLPVEIHYILSLGEHIFRIDNLKIKGDSVKKIFGEEYFKGNFDLNALINFIPPKTILMKTLLKSKDLKTKSFNWVDFEIPAMDLNNFLLKFELNDKYVVNLSDLIIGDVTSPLALNFKGKIFLDTANMMETKVDLNGEFKLSDQLIKSFSILNLFLGQLQVKDGYYQANVTGSLAAPIFK